MTRRLVCLVGALMILVGPSSSAFEVKATIKSVDPEQRLVQFVAGQQERTVKVAPDAKVLDASGNPLAAGLKADALKPGAEVILSVERVENRPLIQGIRLGSSVSGAGQPRPATAQPKEFKPVDTSNLVPLTDLGLGKYQGFEGGLYPDGANARPASHDASGVALAAQVRPLGADGQPADDGKVVLLGIGFSNTVQAFNGFMRVAGKEKDATLNPHLVLVNGAVGGMSAEMVQQTETGRGKQYWATVDERLKAAGVSRLQVQVVWIKETNPQQNQRKFPENARDLQSQVGNIARIVRERFPNVKLAYLSSRTYGGWAKPKADGGGPGNSEPYSFETGFAVKWLIEQQLKGDPALNFDPDKGPVKAPWMSWGPYLWANGTVPRSDGFRFALEDFMTTDQMHESPSGQLKIGGQLLQFFKTDATSRPWFVAGGAP